MPCAVDDIGRAKVVPSTSRVDVTCRIEAALLVEVESDSPFTLADPLAAAPAACTSGWVFLRTVDAWQPAVLDTQPGIGLHSVGIRDVSVVRFQRGQKDLGTLVGGTLQMKPQRGQSVRERVLNTFAHSQFALGDVPSATSALGPPAGGWLDYVNYVIHVVALRSTFYE